MRFPSWWNGRVTSLLVIHELNDWCEQSVHEHPGSWNSEASVMRELGPAIIPWPRSDVQALVLL